MSGNDDGDNNDQYETSTGQRTALMRSNKDQGANGSESSSKKEPLTTENEKEAKIGKESTQRNVTIIHQPHLLLLQKVIHLKENEKRLPKREKNIAARKVHLQIKQILKQILRPCLSK